MRKLLIVIFLLVTINLQAQYPKHCPNDGQFITWSSSNSQFSCSIATLPISFSKVTHQFLDSYNASTGLFTASQPAFTDLSGTINTGTQMPNSGVTAGSYTNTNLTVNAQGLVTAASNGSGGSSTSLSFYQTPGIANNSSGPTANGINLTPFNLAGSMSISKVGIDIITANGAVTGDFGIYNTSGTRITSVGGFTLGTSGIQEQNLSGAPVSIPAGSYYAAWTQTDTSGRIGIWNAVTVKPLSTVLSTTTATGGVLPATISIPAAGITTSILGNMAFTLR